MNGARGYGAGQPRCGFINVKQAMKISGPIGAMFAFSAAIALCAVLLMWRSHWNANPARSAERNSTPQAYTELVEKLAALANHYERAMVTFLNHAEFWRGATLFYHADTLPYWRKRKNLPHQPAAVHENGRQELAGLIRTYFHYTEACGNNCVVEAFPWVNSTTFSPIRKTIPSTALNG